MPRKRKYSIEEEKALDDELIRQAITKEIARQNKAGGNYDLELNLEHSLVKHNARFYPTSFQQGQSHHRKKPRRQRASSEQLDNDAPDFMDVEFPVDVEEGKIGTWSFLLESNMLSGDNGFILPMLYSRSSNLQCTTVTFAIPVLKQATDSSKLDYSSWVFPGFCLLAPDKRSHGPSHPNMHGNSVYTQQVCFFCSCCSKSVACAGSIGLSQVVEPSDVEDACDCLCSKVLRHVISQNNISLEKLADMSSVNHDETELLPTVGGFHLGNVDNGSRDILQYGTVDQPSFGFVVGGKCVKCKGHKACSHVKQYRAQDMQSDEQRGTRSNLPCHLSQDSWGYGHAKDFEERLVKKLNDDRTGLRLRGLSTQTFDLEPSAEKQAAIAERSHLLPQGGSLQDPDKDGFWPTLVSSHSMLFLLNGVKLNIEVNTSTNAGVHPTYVNA